jgi:uncharacterized membrane protein
MTGSSIDFIVIPIVAVISLAAWLITVYYADSHPQWGGDDTRADKANNQRASAGTQLGRKPVPPADQYDGLRS